MKKKKNSWFYHEIDDDDNYVFGHDWGSFESAKTINKIALRNPQDFDDYFLGFVVPVFNATEIDSYVFQFFDNSIIKIEIL